MDHNDTIGSIDHDTVSLATLLRAVSGDIEQLSNTDELQHHRPTEGRVAEIAAGSRPNDIYVGTGDTWLDAKAALGLSAPLQRTTPQDLTAADAPEPTVNGIQAVHDGTGTPPAGTYTSDPANNQWIGADDRTSGTTIAY